MKIAFDPRKAPTWQIKPMPKNERVFVPEAARDLIGTIQREFSDSENDAAGDRRE